MTNKKYIQNIFKLLESLQVNKLLSNNEMDQLFYLYFISTKCRYPTESEFSDFKNEIAHFSQEPSFTNILVSSISSMLLDLKNEKPFFDVTETAFAFYNSGAQRTTRAIYKNLNGRVIAFRWDIPNGRVNEIDQKTHRLLLDYTLLNKTISLDGYQNLQIENSILNRLLELFRRNTFLRFFLRHNLFFRIKIILKYILASFSSKQKFNFAMNNSLVASDLIMTEYGYLNSTLHNRIQMLLKFGGARLHLLFYDSIPFYEPEYFDANKLLSFKPLLDTAKSATTIFVPSKYELDRIRKLIDISAINFKLLYFAGSFDTPTLPDKHIRSPNDKNIIIVAGVEPRKNLQTMIRAVSHSARTIDINLNIIAVTTSHISHITNSIEDLKYLKSLNVFSKISDDHLIRIYRDSDLSLFCTLAEGFGIPIAESGWLEVPVIASNIGTIKEVASLFSRANLVDPRNYLEISRCICESLKFGNYQTEGLLRNRTWHDVAEDLMSAIN